MTCPFCDIPEDRIIDRNELAYAIRDDFPVTPLHSLVIPKRHVTDYFGLIDDEILACDELLNQLRDGITVRCCLAHAGSTT